MENQEHPLSLYDSLKREVRQFVPQDASCVTMYNCGPTVYSYAHIGNARAAVVADVLFRVLRHIYGEDHVRYARNLTDVDDRIIASAMAQGVPISEITEKYARIYNEDLAALNCLPPTVQPKATEHIQGMADIIVTLLDKDAAYIADGHVYFDVTKDEDYGKLSGRKMEDNLAGARVDVVGAKRNAADFVLWKPSPDGEPGWSQQQASTSYFVDWKQYSDHDFASVPGRPGWHIECSAMAKETLGETIDIHCGGIDLKFPHHENEIAQSETCNGKTFANYWVHNEFLNMGKEKMSKSVGNVALVHDLLKNWEGEILRHALLRAPYRLELEWSEELLIGSEKRLGIIYNALWNSAPFAFSKEVSNLPESFSQKLYKSQFSAALSDLVSLAGQLESYSGSIRRIGLVKYQGKYLSVDESLTLVTDRRAGLIKAGNVLGLLYSDPASWLGIGGKSYIEILDALATARHEARQAKDWAEADRIRDEGTARGIVFEDSSDGTTWRKA